MSLVARSNDQRNVVIREKCATPGFGYLVLMCRVWGLGATPYNANTYAEAKVIAERELATGLYESALIKQKLYDPRLALAPSGPREGLEQSDPDDDL